MAGTALLCGECRSRTDSHFGLHSPLIYHKILSTKPNPMSFNPFPNKPCFLRVSSTSLLKTLWEKKKLLVTSNFFFSQGFFLPVWRNFGHFHQIRNYRLQTPFSLEETKCVVWHRVNQLKSGPVIVSNSNPAGKGLRSSTRTLPFDKNGLNPFPNTPWFLLVCSTCLLKTLWEKKKLLVTSNFFFSHSVFYRFRKLPAIFIKFGIVVRKLFQAGRV